MLVACVAYLQTNLQPHSAGPEDPWITACQAPLAQWKERLHAGERVVSNVRQALRFTRLNSGDQNKLRAIKSRSCIFMSGAVLFKVASETMTPKKLNNRILCLLSADAFHSLLSFSHNHTQSLFDSAYKPISSNAKPLVSELFSDLALYLRGDANVSIERSVHNFYDKLFPLVYQQLINPGLGSPVSTWSAEGSECLRATRHDVNPFGPHPQSLAQGLSIALAAGRALNRALGMGTEVLHVTESMGLARQCGQALVRMQYCPHCRGLTLIQPCAGLCLNVMRGCLAGLAELDGPWRWYVAFLERLSGALAGGYEMELTLLSIRDRINDAILTAQLNGPHLSAVVSHSIRCFWFIFIARWSCTICWTTRGLACIQMQQHAQ